MKQEVIDIDRKIPLNKDNVFSLLDCSRDNPVYEELSQCYEERVPWLLGHVQPRVMLAREIPDTRLNECLSLPKDCTGLLYAVLTLGRGPEEESRRCFLQGDYLEGMLVDAMADVYLFAMEAAVMPEIRKVCAVDGAGILKRMEAPGDFPMEFHKYIFEKCGLDLCMDMKLTSGYMFDPVKTSCLVFVQGGDSSLFHAQHDCARCTAKNCPLRR